ncbi:MAG TPA: mechanosensitive ion channel family protein [Acidimicrobiales bacterium]|jgi:small conductance mechanosensitive channel
MGHLLFDVTPERLTDVCGESAGWICEAVLEATDSDGFARAADFLVARPLKITLILVGAWFVNRLIRRAIRRFVSDLRGERLSRRLGRVRESRATALLRTSETPSTRSAQRAETIGVVLRSLSSFVVYGFALLIVLGELGINLGPLIAGAGIVGVALGFGAQSLVRDFLSGIFMLIEDQFGVGDIIDVGEATGEVEGVSLRTTRLRDINGTVWHVPNGEIHRIGNMSQNWARALVEIDVAYATDLERAKEVLGSIAQGLADDPDWKHSFIDAPEVVGVERLGADGISIRVWAKVRPLKQWELQRELRQRIKAGFDREGIEIPFPQRTVWVRNEP